MRMFRVCLVATVFLFLCMKSGVAFCTPESTAGAFFLLISPSARVNGMGNAGTALTDESSGYYNPAAPAFFADAWNVTATSYVGTMKWFNSDNTRYSYHSLQAGGRKNFGGFRNGDVSAPVSLSGAAGYYRTEMINSDITNPLGGTFDGDYPETAHNYVFSGSVRCIAEVGVGAAVKRVRCDYPGPKKVTASATAYDYGVLVNLPVIDLIEAATGERIESNGVAPEGNLSAGASWKNLGDDLEYSSKTIDDDPLPRVFVRGMAGSAGLVYRGAVTLNLFRLMFSRDVYKPRIDGKTVASRYNDDMEGWECSLLDTMAFRGGSYDDDDGEVHYTTRGLTVSSEGLFKLAAIHRANHGKKGYIDYLLSNSAISWTRFEYSGRVYGGTHVSQLTVQLYLQ